MTPVKTKVWIDIHVLARFSRIFRILPAPVNTIAVEAHQTREHAANISMPLSRTTGLAHEGRGAIWH